MDFSTQVQQNIESLGHFMPELILIGLMALLMLIDMVIKREATPWLGVVTLIGGLATLVVLLEQFNSPARGIFNNMMAVDNFAIFFKFIFLASMIMVVLLSFSSIELSGRNVGEYFILLVATTLGMFWMASATSLLTILIAIETVSITSFALATYLKGVRRSSEAGLKYAIYGAFSTGLMLYGLSLLYGLTGTLNISEIAQGLSTSASTNPLTLFVAFLLILAGFGYKIASVPFHFWAPDVYEGAPTPITAFFSVGPKAAGFALLIRFVTNGLSTPIEGVQMWQAIVGVNWQQLLAVVAAATMTLGNLVAIVQDNVKRLLAYSSIAHAGYALIGVVLLTSDGIQATMFYLIAYYLMNLGAFLVVIIVQQIVGSEHIDEYRGLGYRAPVLAACMTIFLFSLTGLPVTIGFVGKFYLLAAVIRGNEQFYWLAVVAIINTVISLYYYARIFKAMYLDAPPQSASGRIALSPSALAMLAVFTIPTLIFGIAFAPLLDLTRSSIEFFSSI